MLIIGFIIRWFRSSPSLFRKLIFALYRIMREFFSYPFWILRWFQYRMTRRKDVASSIGIHTVFIAKENILFLKEWILYHKWKGIEHFFLYDNSGSYGLDKSSHFERMRMNAHGIPYGDIVKLSEADVTDILAHIQREIPNVHIIKWRPTDSEGRIMHAQEKAQNDALKRFGPTVDWMIFMDMDEFMVSSESIPTIARQLESGGYDGGLFYDRVMASRFDHLDKYITDTTLTLRKPFPKTIKYICKVSRTWHVMVHGFVSLGRRYKFAESELFFLHYKLPSSHPDIHDYFAESENPISPQWLDTLKTQGGLYCDVDWKLSVANPEWKRIMESNTWRNYSPDL